MKRFLLGAMLLGTLTVPATIVAQDHDHDNAAPKQYYDRAHKDTHQWTDDENAAWGRYRDEHHVKQTDFAQANKRQQQDYWNWRHEHPDTH